MLTGHATVLLVEDVARAMAYYRDALGFAVGAYDENPGHYGYAERDGCHLHFARFDDARPMPNHQAVPPDMFDAYFWVDNVDATYAEVVARGAQLLHGPVDQGYGLREFRVQDPDGYILAFGRDLGTNS
jgi:catechol 2,3-dioxygenase-like lactoylglutathione lyase family enzyme